MAAIFRASPKGLLESFLAKFETGRSVLDLVLMSNEGPHKNHRKVIKSIYTSDHLLQKYRYNKIKLLNNKGTNFMLILSHFDCSAEGANKLRSTLWKKPIEGVTMPALQHQFNIVDKTFVELTDWNLKNHFEYLKLYPTQQLHSHFCTDFSTGDKEPFLGYKTRSGVLDSLTHFDEKTVTVCNIKDLLDLREWTNHSMLDKNLVRISSNMPVLIEKVLRLYTDVTLPELKTFGGTKRGGTIHHHVRPCTLR